MGIQLQPVLNFTQDCTTLTYADMTPLYNINTAPNGYDDTGVSSLDPDDVDTNNAYLDITDPNGVLTTFQITPANFDKTQIGLSGFSTYSIPAANMQSGRTTFLDGIYKVTYRYKLLSNSRYYQVTVYIANICALRCCMDDALKVLECCDTCKDDMRNRYIFNLYRVHMLVSKIDYLLACNDIQGAKDLIECLEQFCDSTQCDSCG